MKLDDAGRVVTIHLTTVPFPPIVVERSGKTVSDSNTAQLRAFLKSFAGMKFIDAGGGESVYLDRKGTVYWLQQNMDSSFTVSVYTRALALEYGIINEED